MTNEEMEALCEVGDLLDTMGEELRQLQIKLGNLPVSDGRVDAGFLAHDAERSLTLCWRKLRDEISLAFASKEQAAVSRNGSDPAVDDEIPF